MNDEQVLADMFAQEYQHRLSWRKQVKVPGEPFCWHWKEAAQTHWRPLDSDVIPHQWLCEYARHDGLDYSTARMVRVPR